MKLFKFDITEAHEIIETKFLKLMIHKIIET